MYEAITESIDNIKELIESYEEACVKVEAERRAYTEKMDRVSLDEGENPALSMFISEREDAVKQSIQSRLIMEILGRNSMPKREVARRTMQTDEYQEKFAARTAESPELEAVFSIRSAAQLGSADRERYEKILLSGYEPPSLSRRNHLKNLIKKNCRDLIDLIDVKGQIRDCRGLVMGCMKDKISGYFRSELDRSTDLGYVSTSSFDSFVSSYVSRSGDCLHFFRARSIVFGDGTSPFDYVMGIVSDNADPEITEAVQFLDSVDKRIGTQFISQILQSIESKKTLGNSELAEVALYFTRDRVVRLLSQNPAFSDIFEYRRVRQERENRVKNGLLDAIPGSYPELFPLARSMYRHFILHIGPTNSGKSYDAIEALKKADTGIYLAPLRLLAYEKFEELNEAGCRCILKTGEEEIRVPEANLQSSTIEMLDFIKHYEVAVIDEAQMIADPQRGSAWTMALLGVQARTIHVCLAPEAENAVISIIEACEDTFEIQRHKRFVPLVYDPDPPVVFPDKVERGTAFIVFSRRDVHAVAGELQRSGHRCSVIYGALPYDVRRNEVRRYMAGDTDIVVATDAIGMGLNLPIKRIIFLKAFKFDGVGRRMLNYTEIKQIAGRAGRYGMFNEGYVSSEEEPKEIRKALNAVIPQIEQARIGFPFSLIGIEGTVSQLMRKWCEIEAKPGFEVADLSREIGLAEELEHETSDKALVYRFVMFPFDEKSRELKDIWYRLFRTENRGRKRNYLSMLPGKPMDLDSLDQLELSFKICDLLYHYADTLEEKDEAGLAAISRRKNQISAIIMDKLSRERLDMRTCRICGRPLPFHHKYDICARCYSRS